MPGKRARPVRREAARKRTRTLRAPRRAAHPVVTGSHAVWMRPPKPRWGNQIWIYDTTHFTRAGMAVTVVEDLVHASGWRTSSRPRRSPHRSRSCSHRHWRLRCCRRADSPVEGRSLHRKPLRAPLRCRPTDFSRSVRWVSQLLPLHAHTACRLTALDDEDVESYG